MTRALLAVAFAMAAGAAAAQPAPTANPPPAPAQADPATRPHHGPPAARGAVIRIERPDLSVSVRCAEGDTSRACGEIVAQLIEKLAAMPQPERRAGGERGERGYREPERMRGGFRDRDREDDGRPRDRE